MKKKTTKSSKMLNKVKSHLKEDIKTFKKEAKEDKQLVRKLQKTAKRSK